MYRIKDNVSPHIAELIKQMPIRGLSEKTIFVYVENIEYFFKYYRGKKPKYLSIKDINNYQLVHQLTGLGVYGAAGDRVAAAKEYDDDSGTSDVFIQPFSASMADLHLMMFLFGCYTTTTLTPLFLSICQVILKCSFARHPISAFFMCFEFSRSS